MGYHFLLQGIFLTHGLNPCLLHWQADSLPLSHQGSPLLSLTRIIYLFLDSNLASYPVFYLLNNLLIYTFTQVQFSSVAQSCLTLCDPMNRSTPDLPVHHHLPEFTQTQSIESVMPSSHLILGRPLLLLSPMSPISESFPMSQLFT